MKTKKAKSFQFTSEYLKEAKKEWLKNVTNEDIEAINGLIQESKEEMKINVKKAYKITFVICGFSVLSFFSLLFLIPLVICCLHLLLTFHNFKVHSHMYTVCRKDKEEIFNFKE